MNPRLLTIAQNTLPHLPWTLEWLAGLPCLTTTALGHEWSIGVVGHTRPGPNRWALDCAELSVKVRASSLEASLDAMRQLLVDWSQAAGAAVGLQPYRQPTPPTTPTGPVICDDADEAAIEVLPLRWQRVQLRICDVNGRQMAVAVDWVAAVELGERLVELAKLASTGAPRPGMAGQREMALAELADAMGGLDDGGE